MKITAVKGFNDILPQESQKWQYVENIVKELFRAYGYNEVRLPIVESTEVFSRSIGEATDIVEKEMYSFLDKNGASLTLRPEGTASVVRAFVENALHLQNPVNKLYYMGPMFRYERPQKGRYRQFHQIGAEVFGADDPLIDAEMLSMIMEFLGRINVNNVTLQINSLGCEDCRLEYKKALVDYFDAKKDALCENCKKRLRVNPLRILDCKVEACKELKKDAPPISKFLCEGCATHFTQVKAILNDLSVPFEQNERLVRGLDYYTKTTFEVTTDMLGSQNAVAAGGRYDNLCELFGGPKTPGVGFAIGVERLILLLDKDLNYQKKPQLFVAAMGNNARVFSYKLLNELRKQNISCEMEYSEKSLKSQMRHADKGEFQFVIILGEEELKKNSAKIRDMATKEEKDVALDNIVDEITNCCK